MNREISPLAALKQNLSNENLLLYAILDGEGEITPEIEQALIDTERSLESNVDWYFHFKKRLESEMEYRKANADRERAIQRRIEEMVERLDESLKENMIQHHKKEISGIDYRFCLSKTKPKIELRGGVSIDELPTSLVRTKLIRELDKELVREVLDGDDALMNKFFQKVEGYSLRSYPNTRSPKQIDNSKRSLK